MTDLSHGRIADAAAVWLSKPFSSLVVQELSTTSWPGYGRRKFVLDVVGVTPNAGFIKIVECKSSRADFLRGREKLEIYKEFCHQLYVAAPRGMVAKDELPAGVGLLEVSDRGAARRKHPAQYGRTMATPGNYTLILERVLQKLVVTQWRPSYAGRRPGTEDQHFPGDGCGESAAPLIRSHLKHQDDLYELSWQDWLSDMEREVV